MTMNRTPHLILVTNDDGWQARGLGAAVQAVWGLGEVRVAVPWTQQTGASRSLPSTIGGITETTLPVEGTTIPALIVQGTPAQTVQYALNWWCPRRPALLVSGINQGENVGSDVTVSGTVGAAIEGACLGIPGLAISLETGTEHHFSQGEGLDFTAAIAIARRLVALVLAHGLPAGVDVLKIDVPAEATPHTPWRLARTSRLYYWLPAPYEPDPADPTRLRAPYYRNPARFQDDPDSDVTVLAAQRHVAVVPLTIDLTARQGWEELAQALGLSACPTVG